MAIDSLYIFIYMYVPGTSASPSRVSRHESK
jgi:hypothetical protein